MTQGTRHHQDVDPVVITRLVSGTAVPGASRIELATAVARLTKQHNASAREIAHRWHCTVRSVTRYRAHARELGLMS